MSMNDNRAICCIFRRPALYREPIHRLMDRVFDIDWYFGNDGQDIKCYDTAIHERSQTLPVKKIFGSLYYAKGELGLLFRKEYQTFLMLNSTHNISVWAFALCKNLFFPKKKVYYWCHGWYGKETWIEKRIKKFLFSAADGIFTYGEYARDLMICEGIDGSKIWPIHNSLDHDRQVAIRQSGLTDPVYVDHFGNKFPVLIFIGRLTPVKRIDLLIKAMSNLRERGCDYNLILVGDGAEREKLEHLAREKNLGNRVWFYSACYDEAINARLIHNADLCVAPGNIGLTAMHTMVFGTPALTHDSFEWQMPEFQAIKDGQTGTFFHKDDVESLADAIQRWFENHTDREAIRQACYDEIDNNWTPQYQINVLKININLR